MVSRSSVIVLFSYIIVLNEKSSLLLITHSDSIRFSAVIHAKLSEFKGFPTDTVVDLLGNRIKLKLNNYKGSDV